MLIQSMKNTKVASRKNIPTPPPPSSPARPGRAEVSRVPPRRSHANRYLHHLLHPQHIAIMAAPLKAASRRPKMRQMQLLLRRSPILRQSDDGRRSFLNANRLHRLKERKRRANRCERRSRRQRHVPCSSPHNATLPVLQERISIPESCFFCHLPGS